MLFQIVPKERMKKRDCSLCINYRVDICEYIYIFIYILKDRYLSESCVRSEIVYKEFKRQEYDCYQNQQQVYDLLV